MATLGHVAIGMALGRLYAREGASSLPRCMAAFGALSLAPDLDFLLDSLVGPENHPLAHRMASHSLAVAVAGGTLIAGLAARWGAPWRRTALFAVLALALHGMVDTLSDEGRGVALLWPLTPERFVSAWRPVPGLPSLEAVFSTAVIPILFVEALLFAPFLIYAFAPVLRLARLRSD